MGTRSTCNMVMVPICDDNRTANQNAAQSKCNPAPFNWNTYDKLLKDVRRMAVGTNIFYGLNWFLGLCALTWATTVILGGIVTLINKRDYYFVAILLLLETIRLACARFFGFSVTRYRIRGKTDPNRINYKDCRNVTRAELLRIAGHVVLLIVLGISIVIPFRALRSIHYAKNKSSNFNSVEASLHIFYIIVLANAVIAVLGVFYARIVVYFYIGPESHSVHKYYDTIVWNGLQKGLFESTDLELLKFAFRIQADEYRHNKRAQMVMYVYENLMLYLYDHPKRKGFEATSVALDSPDIFLREAAANIVGCWVTLRKRNGEGIESLLLQEKLLKKLASALEHEETGRAASYSFEALAAEAPAVTAKVRSESGEKLSSILMKRIHEAVELGKLNKSVVFIKALIQILPENEYQQLLQSSTSSSEGQLSNLDINKNLNALIDYVKQQDMYDNGAQLIFDAVSKLLLAGRTAPATAAKCPCSSTGSSSQQGSTLCIISDVNFSREIKSLHKDLIIILRSHDDKPGALKRTKAAAAKALHTIYSHSKLKSLIDESELLTASAIIASLMAPPNRKQHILTDEWKYFTDVVNGFKSQISPNDNNLQQLLQDDKLPDTWESGIVDLREIPNTHNLPSWLKNIKMTSWIVAAVMACSFVAAVYVTLRYIP